MKLMKILAAVGLLQAATLGASFAQTPASDEDIVVRAPSASDQGQVHAFVTSLTVPTRTRTPMPRWYRPLCVGVVGMQATQAQVFNDRVGEVGEFVGLQAQEPGCRPNVLIHFTSDAAGLSRSIADQRNLVSVNNSTGNSAGDEALQNFVQTSDAVRWWHVSRSATDGVAFGRSGQANGEQDRTRVQEWAGAGSRQPGEYAISEAQQREFDRQDATNEEVANGARVREMSRISGGVMEMMDYVIIVIDANQTGHTTVGALADYIAMVTLAQINPEAETEGAPTILNLFAGGAAQHPTQLTSWDLAYLRGLYESSDTPRSTRQQEGQIVRRMMRQ